MRVGGVFLCPASVARGPQLLSVGSVIPGWHPAAHMQPYLGGVAATTAVE